MAESGLRLTVSTERRGGGGGVSSADPFSSFPFVFEEDAFWESCVFFPLP